MASIQKYQTKNGAKWLFKVFLGNDPSTGKKVYTTKRGFKTEREAKAGAVKVQNAIYTGNHVAENKILFETFIEEWLKEYEHSGIKTSTLINRKTTSIPHLKRLLGKSALNKINSKSFNHILQTLQQEGYSKDTVDNVYITGRMILKNALEKGLIRELPIVKKPKKKKTLEDLMNEEVENHYLEKSELKHLLSITKARGQSIDYGILLVLAFTGMRIGELVALKWDDINYDNKTIRIWKTLFREKNTIQQFELTPPKTKKSIRTISVSDEVLNELQDIQIQQNELRKNSALVLDENFVFIKMDGDYCGYPELSRGIGYRLKKYLRLAGISKEISLHKFRHTHISLLCEAGVDLPTIQERVGHENASTTLKIYLHITKQLKDDSVKKFSKLMDLDKETKATRGRKQ